jgi:hypothetical protein
VYPEEIWTTTNEREIILLGLEVLMVLTMKIAVFCDITSRRLVEKYQRFGGLFSLNFQDI